MKKDINWNLFHRYFSGECTFEEEERIREWIARDSKHREFVEKLKELWEVKPDYDIKLDANDGWEKISRRLDINITDEFDSDTTSNHRKKEQVKHAYSLQYVWSTLFKIAALLLIVATGFYVYLYYTPPSVPKKTAVNIDMQQVSTGKGEHSTIKFSDGTRIVLNAVSRVRFPKAFRYGKRIVYLDGEAYFDVAHLADNSEFIVQTNEARVKVHGTKFNVTAWKDEKQVRIVVEDGSVGVRSKTAPANNEVLLTRGEYSVVEKGNTPSSPVSTDISKYLGWLEGKIIFEGTPFRKVISQLERTFDVTFDVEDPTILQTPFTSRFDNDSLDKVLHIISQTMDLKIKRNGKTVKVSPKESL